VDEELAPQDAAWTTPPADGSRFASNDPEGAMVGQHFADLALPGPPTWSDAGSTDSSAAGYITRQFQQLVHANEALQNEVSRCHDRLNVVLEISEHSAAFKDPGAIEAALLGRYAGTLGAAALLLDRDGCCAQVRVGEAGTPPLGIAPGRIHAALAAEIETVRRTRHARCLSSSETQQRGLGDIQVLLGALQEDAEQPQVVIAIRGAEQPPFNRDDQLASETVLTYGGHIRHNVLMVQRLQQASLETVGALANAIEARDKYTHGHSQRVGALAVLTGQALDLPAGELQTLEWSGLLHDVGKIGIPEHILNKPGDLTADEFEQVKQHPRLGYNVLRPVSGLKPVLDAVLYHHENYDGSGYPLGLSAEDIPVAARILHVVDIFDALTSSRAYRQRLGVDEALELLEAEKRRITDPVITAAFINALNQLRRSQPEEFMRRFARQ
jgi:HD-GYP domain-containing protein (c-di-GMP phosphodiesterase class II)